MATGDRTKAIFGKTQLILGTTANFQKVAQDVPDQLILDTIGDVALELCRDLLCLEKSTTTLAVASGAASEPSGYLRAKLLVAPSGLVYQLVETDLDVYDALSLRQTISYAAQTPLFYKRWGGTITFFPTPSNGNYTLYYFGVPTTTPSGSVDPETPAYMDKAIEMGVVAQLAPVVGRMDLIPIFTSKFEIEKRKALEAFRRTKTIALTILPHEQ